MSSTECVLQNARPERPGEFTFTWSIHNYSYCMMGEEQGLRSPDFKVEFLGDDKWYLSLYPRGALYSVPGFVSFYLFNYSGSSYEDFKDSNFNFTLSIRKSNGDFDEGSVTSYFIKDSRDFYRGYPTFMSCVELTDSNKYFVNDILTLRCRIWKTAVDIPESMKVEAHSRIKVSKLVCTWIINGISVPNQAFVSDFNRTIDIAELLSKNKDMNMQVFKKEYLRDGTIHFGIEMGSRRTIYFWKAVVNLIDANGRVAHSVGGKHLFEDSDSSLQWTFPIISKEELYNNKQLYLPKNQLTLQCELGFAKETSSIDQESELHRFWHKNMQQWFENKQFNDFIIRTPASQFPVSRNILSAHSEVFGAMFERDMKEGKTWVVDIEDLEDDTVNKMLMYVYTSTFDANDCSSARKLYYAADKYHISALQKMCSKFLMSCLDASNFCDILELADTHQDEELKSVARDFFRFHAKEIISSERWKKLRKTHPFFDFRNSEMDD